MDESAYPVLEAAGRLAGYRDLGLSAPQSLQTFASQAGSIRYPDYLALEKARLEVLRGAYPQESRYSILLARHNQGIFVPESRILPLGDNRDNSRDGRYFGPVKSAKILGRASIIYWPGDFPVRKYLALDRFGAIK
jgi:signal peptidase I